MTTTHYNYIIIALVVLMSISGWLSYSDEQDEERVYCEMVRDGIWPAYRAEIQCETAID